MYVHTYQIDNVLNVYRKQLSEKTKSEAPKTASAPSALDRVNLSHDSQRQSIIDQVSADIVQRIVHYGQKNRFQEPLEPLSWHTDGQARQNADKQATSFSYTLIDENNHKQTNVFQFNKGGPLIMRNGETDPETENGQ